MIIQEAIKKAEAVKGGIINKAADVNGVYYSPIGNFDSFIIVPKGRATPEPGDVREWTPCTTELLGDDWEVYRQKKISSTDELREILNNAAKFIVETLEVVAAELDLLKDIKEHLKYEEERNEKHYTE